MRSTSCAYHCFIRAYSKEALAKPLMESSVLYMPMPTPAPSNWCTSHFRCCPPPLGVNTSSSLPGSVTCRSVARYWSPNACLAHTCRVRRAVPLRWDASGGRRGGGGRDFQHAGLSPHAYHLDTPCNSSASTASLESFHLQKGHTDFPCTVLQYCFLFAA